MSHVFISYSRKQFYFTEWLVLRLQERDVQTWFDAQLLMPGISWQHTLREGLDSCTGLVLVASRAALASDYVRAEWQSALEANKPVYVVLFEAVQLPPELQSASIFDCRGDSGSVYRLVTSILEGKIHRDPLPKPNRFHLPTSLPGDVWLIIIALWSQVLAFVLVTIFIVGRITYVSFDRPAAISIAILFGIAWSVLAGYACYFPLGFIYRQHIALNTLRGWLVAFSLILWCFWLGIPVFFENNELETLAASFGISLTITPLNWLLFLFSTVYFCFFMMGPWIFAFRVLPTSQDVFRWMATGTVPENPRQPWRLTLPFGRQAPLGDESSKKPMTTFRLHYHVSDEPFAVEVQSAFEQGRFLRPSHEKQADIHIAILSNKSSREWLDSLTHYLPNLVCLVISSIRFPVDEAIVRQTQWVDYRSRSSTAIQIMKLHLSRSEAGVIRFSHPLVPVSWERLVVPRYVWIMYYLFLVLPLFNLGIGTATIIALLQYGKEHSALGTLPVASVGIALLLFWLADRLMSRNLTYYGLLAVIVMALVSMYVLGTLEDLFRLFGFIGVGLLVTPLFVLFYMHKRLLVWLPRRGRYRLYRQKRPTLALPCWKQLLPSKALYVLIAMGLVIFQQWISLSSP